jgi:hypothetical protein
MVELVPGDARCEVVHMTLYRVDQRLAKTFRKGRAFLIGDAAHTPGSEFCDRLIQIAGSAATTRAYLLAVSMISSLKRAQELG